VAILNNLNYAPQYHSLVTSEGSDEGTAECLPNLENAAVSGSTETDGRMPTIGRHTALNLWLGQYNSYIDHLHGDLVDMHIRNQRAAVGKALDNSLSVPERPSSSTPTAASVVFTIPYSIVPGCSEDVCPSDAVMNGAGDANQSMLRVMVSAGKALDEREMFVRVTSSRGGITPCFIGSCQCNHNSLDVFSELSSDHNQGCSVTYGVQGGVHKHAPESKDSGAFLLLEGSCWTELKEQSLRLPHDWYPDTCSPEVLKGLVFDGSSDEDLSASEKEGGGAATPHKCVIRPLHMLQSESVRVSTGGEANEPYPVQFSSKHRNNAYVEIFAALFHNDRSYFTTTEVRRSHCTITDVLRKPY
jgi:hypothetical protein